MSRAQLRSACLVFGTLVLSQAALAEGPYQLRYRFPEGLRLVYRMVLDQTTEMTASTHPGPAQKMGTRMDVDLYHKVIAPAGDGARMEIGFERVEAKVELGGNRLPVPGMEEIDRLKMALTMSSRGQMSAVNLIDADKLGPQAQRITQEMKKSIAQNALVFPDKPLMPGEGWSSEQRVPTNLGSGQDLMMDVKSSYKLVGIERQAGKSIARIETQVALSLHGKTEQMGMPIQADLEGSGTGVALFLIDAGQMLQTQASFAIQGQISSQNQGQQATTGLKIAMQVDLKLK